jgi:hypothetical protein
MEEKKANQPLMMRRDYDSPEATMIKPLEPVRDNRSLKLICPTCEEVGNYEPEEDVNADSLLVCPKCASKIEISMFTKTASGEYRVKQASYVDPNFSAIREILPKKAEEVTLSKAKVSLLLKHLGRIEGVCSKVQKALRDK